MGYASVLHLTRMAQDVPVCNVPLGAKHYPNRGKIFSLCRAPRVDYFNIKTQLFPVHRRGRSKYGKFQGNLYRKARHIVLILNAIMVSPLFYDHETTSNARRSDSLYPRLNLLLPSGRIFLTLLIAG